MNPIFLARRNMSVYHIRPVREDDKMWVSQLIQEHWGSEIVVAHQTVYTPTELPGFIVVQGGQRVGLVTYQIQGNECEIVSLNSLMPSVGIGSKLVGTVVEKAREEGCQRVWLITTNDNVQALRFYQKRGFRLVGVHRNAVDESRKIKREIPILGENGIPIRDEIELEMILTGQKQV
jgi:N-acetylglutamate synthase-like GNAT family acetyltransferase